VEVRVWVGGFGFEYLLTTSYQWLRRVASKPRWGKLAAAKREELRRGDQTVVKRRGFGA